MSTEVRKLEPKILWNHFSDLNEVPRPSKKEEKVIQFMVNFGKNLHLNTRVDSVGNVIITKPATKGYENRKTIVLQSHLDMVHQKNSDTVFDFETQGINMLIDGDWVTADGTTLGADNGLGVATIMAVLSSDDIEHPPIEALFTIDEETGMTGAMGLQRGLLKGEILLNLDTEEDDEIDIGCAGGIDVTATRWYKEEKTPEKKIGFKISITGLQGGHSGMDIHKGLGNANKIMNRILYHGYTNFNLQISELEGGSLRNAIPRESFSNVVIDETLEVSFLSEINSLIKIIKTEFKSIEPNLSIDIHAIKIPKKVIPIEVQEKFIKSIYTALNGVYRMSNDIPNLVESSNNIAKVIAKGGKITIACLTRSSSESSKEDVANSLRSCFELSECKVEFSGSYPGWQPNMDSEILKIASSLYKKLFKEEASVVACHAGLECGILGQNYPNMDMISFGPTIKGAHSPDERVSISSVKKFWFFLLEILKKIPDSNA
ncbi:MAG: Cytosol non-specific dipeptidase [Flavobacterium sp. SCGC AAA160-P02]|nr:MAG: Cytosol non-specific dipeptidase [Flavobacterium sp. SCGC AAA160-P02]